MKLADLLPADAVSDARLAALEVAGVSADSRSIKPGDLFVAVAGAKADGLEFLPQALAAAVRP
jgi:UDP-N-acetylmuramoyl-L-alanyl-D-glutamate--2,6-diaminopimelate ligase